MNEKRLKSQYDSSELLAKLRMSVETLAPESLDEPPDLEGDLVPVLRERYRQLKLVSYTLRPGMIVTWKPGLQNRRMPAYGTPAIVVSVLADPQIDYTDDSGTPYFREALDVVIGLFIDTGPMRGHFATYHCSSERLQPWAG